MIRAPTYRTAERISNKLEELIGTGRCTVLLPREESRRRRSLPTAGGVHPVKDVGGSLDSRWTFIYLVLSGAMHKSKLPPGVEIELVAGWRLVVQSRKPPV
jgi:hypothetical protein